MASQLLGIKTRFTNDLGSPLVGGQVYTYFAGTSTNQDSYSDAALTVPNTNPVILDDTGSADIFLKGSYRIRVFDKSGRFIEEQDNVTQAASQGDATELSNKVTTLESGLSTANTEIDKVNTEIDKVNTEIDKVKLDTGVTATAKYGGVSRKLSDVLSEKRRTPWDFGALGGSNDDTAAVVACINTGYFLIDDKFTVQPFVISNKYLDGVFGNKGELEIISVASVDSIVFQSCSGIMNGFKLSESYSGGVYSSFVLRECQGLDVKKLTTIGGKLVPVVMVDCDDCNIYEGKGVGTVEQRPFEWLMSSCSNSKFINCRLEYYQFGFVLTGSAYKSGTRFMSTRPILETVGMQVLGSTVINSTNTCFDINGAVGAEIDKCVANQQGASTSSPGFQIKQSSNVAEELALGTIANKVSNCIAIDCAKGYQSQKGHLAEFINNTAINTKASPMVINGTPRSLIDGLQVYNWGLGIDTYDSTYEFADVISLRTGSSSAVVNNIRVYIDELPSAANQDKMRVINNEGNYNSIDNVVMSVLGTLSPSIAVFLRNTGSNSRIGANMRLMLSTHYKKVIDDTTTTALYPFVLSKVIDFSGETGNEPFPSLLHRGMIAAKISIIPVTAVDSESKFAVGIVGDAGRLYGLNLAPASFTVVNPLAELIPLNTALLIRKELGTSPSGQIIVQVHGLGHL